MEDILQKLLETAKKTVHSEDEMSSSEIENELRKTILSNRNRTCIVQWELFNEINRPILTQMLHKMAMLARDLDPSRMILDESGGWGEGANLYLPYLGKILKATDFDQMRHKLLPLMEDKYQSIYHGNNKRTGR